MRPRSISCFHRLMQAQKLLTLIRARIEKYADYDDEAVRQLGVEVTHGAVKRQS